MTAVLGAPFIARRERFATVGSTNDVVRGWLAERTPEVCLAVADEQTAGRGRDGRPWTAPVGRALLLSLGFRPAWLRPERVWRLAATVSLAMAAAGEEIAGLPEGAIRLKWPNDLVVEPTADEGAGAVRKLAGVLGETDGLGTADPTAVVGIGINADWAAAEFPAEIAPTMTSLRVAAGGRPIDADRLLDAFMARLETRVADLREGRFDGAAWTARQLTDGRLVRLTDPDGRARVVRAVRCDPDSGALVVEDGDAPGGVRAIVSGEIRHLRLGEGV